MMILLMLLFSFFSKKGELTQHTIHGYAQGTSYTVKYFCQSPLITTSAVDSILLKIDSSMSLYKNYSLISKFNSSAGAIKMDDHFAVVMRKSFEIYKETNGLFDVTVAPLVQVWGFGVQPIDHFPDSAAVRKIMDVIGMNYLKLSGNELSKSKPGVKIDLNGIAQGYSVDAVAAYLLAKGITCFVVEIGGELVCRGLKPDGTAMRIGVEGPSSDTVSNAQFKHIVSFTDGALTTSGNYQRYLQNGPGKISHLINPKTGYPLESQLISVTIYAKDALTADGYDNAVMAMGVEEALQFVSAKRDMEAYLIFRQADGCLADTMTTGFRKMIVN